MKLTLLLFLLILFSCAKNKSDNTVAGDCTAVDSSLRNPQSISDTLTLLNALPKPTNLDCFITALQPPLQVFAVNSTSSAQPAQGIASPRIFILKNKLSLSVVPDGLGKTLLELGEESSGKSFKAEIRFPVDASITIDQVTQYLSNGTSTSSCSGCHLGEAKVPYANSNGLFFSNIFRPDESLRVSQSYMKIKAETCDSDTNTYRCTMLKAIYINGQAVDSAFSY